MKRNRGITLIALIITIIILLILVGVSVNLLIKGDLFGSAEKAVNGTNAKVEEEQSRVDELMDELADVEKQNSVHNWQYTDNTRAKIRCTCTGCKLFDDGDPTGRTLSIGQQIGETEYVTASTNITEEQCGNWSQTIELNNDETKWVVFGYEDRDGDNANEVLLLTTEKTTGQTVWFGGAIGYNNGKKQIDRMCRELYGHDARGITIEDVNRALGYEPTGGMYYDENQELQMTENLTTKLSELSVWDKIKKQGTYTPDGTNDETTLGNYKLDGYEYLAEPKSTASVVIPVVENTIASNAKAMIFGSNSDYGYWLTSRGISVEYISYWISSSDVLQHGYYACFGLGFVSSGWVSSNSKLQSSAYNKHSSYRCLRPLVAITSEVPAAGEIPAYLTKSLDFIN